MELSYGNVDINVGAIFILKQTALSVFYLNLYFHLCVPLHIQITLDLLI